MALPKDCKQVRVTWDGRPLSTVFVPTEIVDSYDPKDDDAVSEYLSDTFGYLVQEWEVVA